MTKRLTWLTDLHLNFVKLEHRRSLYATIRQADPDALLLSGDIAEAPTLLEHLHELQRAVAKPVYFVLGNHDFYRSSMANVRAQMKQIETRNLVWLTGSGVQPLTDFTALIGDDGWADGRLGMHVYSSIFLNDYQLINEFIGLGQHDRFRMLNALGDAAAERLKAKLRDACAQRKRVIMLTHVPPFREACWHQGGISDDDWLPHFSCKAMGDAIVEVMDRHPENDLRVFCGHTHGAGVTQPRPNIVVKTGGAIYGAPAIQETFEV